MNWINPNTIVGTKATGRYYFERSDKEAEIWELLLKGSHVLLAAPRRVGKSSIMENMIDRRPAGVECIYKNIQGLITEEGFYKTIYTLTINCLNRYEKLNKRVASFLKSLNITSITLEGIEFSERKEPDYLAEVNALLPKLADTNVHVVLMLDELPELLHKLHKAGKGGSAR
jgi:uncharacterized protein